MSAVGRARRDTTIPFTRQLQSRESFPVVARDSASCASPPFAWARGSRSHLPPGPGWLDTFPGTRSGFPQGGTGLNPVRCQLPGACDELDLALFHGDIPSVLRCAGDARWRGNCGAAPFQRHPVRCWPTSRERFAAARRVRQRRGRYGRRGLLVEVRSLPCTVVISVGNPRTADSKVTLSGNVHSWFERDEARRAAWAAPGVERSRTASPSFRDRRRW